MPSRPTSTTETPGTPGAAAALGVGAGPLGEDGLVGADLALDAQLDRPLTAYTEARWVRISSRPRWGTLSGS